MPFNLADDAQAMNGTGTVLERHRAHFQYLVLPVYHRLLIVLIFFLLRLFGIVVLQYNYHLFRCRLSNGFSPSIRWQTGIYTIVCYLLSSFSPSLPAGGFAFYLPVTKTGASVLLRSKGPAKPMVLPALTG